MGNTAEQIDTTREHSALYSPEDDKIRIYPAYRLPREEYDQLIAAGYQWAPKQKCFYAVWAPNREATALQFADEIGDEDTTLAERAEDRAERFEQYSDNRAQDAARAGAGVAAIAENIPFGQPILVGHHSERRARKDAQKIENGMRHAVKMWETSEYWMQRAAGAVANAKYKERPDVRARRIKGLEAGRRKQEKNKAEAEKWLSRYNDPEIKTATLRDGRNLLTALLSTYESGLSFEASRQVERGELDTETALETAKRRQTRTITHCETWLNHINNRLVYEKAMLAEGGGLRADKFNFAIGGQVLRRGSWHIITKLNKQQGIITSVSVTGHFAATIQIEEIADYKEPTQEQTQAVEAATKLPPMCNYITDGCATMTQAEYKAEYADHKGSRLINATDTHDTHRIRRIASFRGRKFGAVTDNSYSSQFGSVLVFISDAKVKQAPPLAAVKDPAQAIKVPAFKVGRATPEEIHAAAGTETPAPTYIPEPINEQKEAMKSALKQGIQVVSAPQLFPTPPRIAAQMVEWLDPGDNMLFLEPSAGTGRLLDAIFENYTPSGVYAIEQIAALASALTVKYEQVSTRQANFLEWNDRKDFDRIIMNPPFQNGSDILHIRHAMTLLKPGGRLVALCANGPRQQAAFKDMAEYYEPLPAGSFQEQGTGVNVAMVVIQG